MNGFWGQVSPGQTVTRPADPLDSVAVFLEGGRFRSGTGEIERSAGQVVYSSRRADAHTEQAVEGSPRAVIVEIK